MRLFACRITGRGPAALALPDTGDYTLVLIQSGTATYRSRHGVVPLAPGNSLLLTGDGDRMLRDPVALTAWCLPLDRDVLLDMLRCLWRDTGLVRLLLGDLLFSLRFHQGMLHLESTKEEMSAWSGEIAAMQVELGRTRPSLSYVRGCLLKILAELNRALLREDEGACLPLREEIWAVADFVESQVMQGAAVSVDELANQAGLSRAQFIRMWRHATGSSPMDYYQRRRVLYAARLLAEDPDTITEISHRMGFSDAAHFCRQFKRIMGVNPTEYRRQTGKGPGGYA
jgi:AraC-like DNA-binding protein